MSPRSDDRGNPAPLLAALADITPSASGVARRVHDGRTRPSLIRAGALLGGAVAAILVGGWTGLAIGALLAVCLDPLLRRLEPAAARRQRLREAADLPLAADLLAAALRSGAPTGRAVAAVAEVLAGPLGVRLSAVARTLQLGGDPEEAWAYVAPVTGGDRLTRAAVRSSASGAALARALSRLADDLRADQALAAEAAARQAGVLIVLPLGLCFLPAFILAGLVPVIVAVLGDVL
jgi:pilus assembly protein TadC